MSAYRFCRSDDVPLIVEAFHRCNVGPGRVPWRLTVDDMKRLSREINLWTSSCMVALAGSDPIGVLIAAKREPTANLVLHVGVHPDHRRQGHARHMLTSLTQKMAILEPTRMFAEVPAEAIAARRFLSACGFAEEATLTDYVHDGKAPVAGPFLDLVGTVSAQEIIARAEFADASEFNRCWQRTTRTIQNLRQQVLGAGIATDRGFEAYLLYRSPVHADKPLPFMARARDPARNEDMPDRSTPCEILALGGQRPVPALLGPVLAFAAGKAERPLFLPRVHRCEPMADHLDDYGFRAARETLRYACDAALS